MTGGAAVLDSQFTTMFWVSIGEQRGNGWRQIGAGVRYGSRYRSSLAAGCVSKRGGSGKRRRRFTCRGWRRRLAFGIATGNKRQYNTDNNEVGKAQRKLLHIYPLLTV
jgi:hypothetical protein